MYVVNIPLIWIAIEILYSWKQSLHFNESHHNEQGQVEVLRTIFYNQHYNLLEGKAGKS